MRNFLTGLFLILATFGVVALGVMELNRQAVIYQECGWPCPMDERS